MQLQPRSSLGGGVACRSLQATLISDLARFQRIPRMTPHQREGEDTWDRYTVTDMCVDLVCCLDTLEQDTTCQYKNVANTTQQENMRSTQKNSGESHFLGRHDL